MGTAKALATRHGELTPIFSLSHRLVRLIWSVSWTLLASWTPATLWRWRVFLLRLFGAKIGSRSDVRGSARVWHPKNLRIGTRSIIAGNVNCYNMAPIVIGDYCTISRGAFLCGGSHNVDVPDFLLITKEIVIGHHVWIAAEAMVGPGAQIGEGAVLGARGVAFGRLEPWTIYTGNPAAPRRTRVRWAKAEEQ